MYAYIIIICRISTEPEKFRLLGVEPVPKPPSRHIAVILYTYSVPVKWSAD